MGVSAAKITNDKMMMRNIHATETDVLALLYAIKAFGLLL
jgi:hypothetical protein